MADKNKLTPVMQQYVDMKAENPDALLMFRLGDFFEAFFEDAKTISAALGLVLTQRGTDGDGENIPMCGIPWHAADNYFGRLVRAGYRVALVEQMETPAQAKARGHKFIDRKIVRVLTPGTLNDENLLTPKNSNFLVAVVPLSDGRFDIAGCDISTGEFFVGQTPDILDDLVRINPAEVIYPASVAEQEIFMQLRGAYKTTPVYEKLYHRGDIDTIVSRVFGGAIDTGVVSHESNCRGAIALMAGYLFNTQRDAAITFRAPYVYKSGHQLLIDSATWKSLEIDSPINDGGTCLIDVLDNTKTAAGARKLRSYLRTLSADADEIRRRQGHIGHMVLNPDVMAMVSAMLASVPDVGRSLSRLLSGRATPRDMRHITDFLIELPNAKMMATRLDADFVARFAEIRTHDNLALELKSALADELPTFFRDGNVIRAGFDAALDNMRSLAHGARETIATLQAEYAAAILPKLQAKAIVVDTNIPEGTIRYICDNSSIPVYADPVSTAKAVKLLPVLHRLSAIKPNALEAEALTGERDPERAARALVEKGVKRAFISLGSQGMIAAEGKELLHLPIPPTRLVNVTGAGDAAMAAIVLSGIKGLGLRETAELALRAGSITCGSESPNTEELKEILKIF